MITLFKFFGYGYVNGAGMGGLGNGLFQLATALVLAKENQDEFALHNESDWVYNNYLKHPIKILKDSSFRNSFIEEGLPYKPITHKENMSIHGYFQSENHFKDHFLYIKEKFRLNEEYESKVNNQYKDIGRDSRTCSLHVRRGDYVTSEEDTYRLLGLDYYNEAIEMIKKKNKDVKFLVFSDDINWCKENIHGINFTFIESNDDGHQGEGDDILDMHLMSMCHDNIISNSSFSWWGAWLNENENKFVICPKKWFGRKEKEVDHDIIPEKWTKI
jgi:hypothetical protein